MGMLFPPSRIIATVAAAAALCVPAYAAKREPPPVQLAASYPAHDTHEKEHVTIAADPFDSRDKGDFFRLDYVGHSFMPIRVIVQNDSDKPLDLNDVRIQFIGADGTKLPAATPEEINRRLFRFKQIQERRIPGTPIPYHPTPVDKKITDDDRDFSFTQTVIAPHSSASGFLFYDVQDLDQPVLENAELYVKMIHEQGANGTRGPELFGFSIPFDKYLDAQRAAKKAADAARNSSKDKDKQLQ